MKQPLQTWNSHRAKEQTKHATITKDTIINNYLIYLLSS
jgi:hypothetical protein